MPNTVINEQESRKLSGQYEMSRYVKVRQFRNIQEGHRLFRVPVIFRLIDLAKSDHETCHTVYNMIIDEMYFRSAGA